MSKTPENRFDRRRFLASMLCAPPALGAALGLPGREAFASHPAASVQKTLVNLMLYGGADLRYLFAPDPSYDPEYVDKYWTARRNLYNTSYLSYADMFAGEYTLVTDPLPGGYTFGIHNTAGWLAAEFAAGNVAVIANTFASLNRRHDHSQLIVQTGDIFAGRTDYDREGWGGRLVETLSGSPNVVELSDEVQIFCNGSDESFRLAQVVHAEDAREMGIPSASSGTSYDDAQIRALNAYYAARGTEMDLEKPPSWPFRKFFQHYAALRHFGGLMEVRLSDHPVPTSLSEPGFDLDSSSFERQCRNLYDVCLAPDILDFRVISMEYGGWDTHTNQIADMLVNLPDVFGTGGGLDTVMGQLALDVPSAASNLVFTFPWDFGRQLAANGSNGTDHGRGSYTILVGNKVQGGVYGEFFPLRESVPDPEDSQGRTPFEISGRDIDGLTSLEHVWARISDWLQPGIGSTVFPGAVASPLESGVDFTNLLVV